MIVAVVRGARFELDRSGYRQPVLGDTWKASQAVRDVAEFFGFDDRVSYGESLTAEGRGILRRLTAKLRRELGVKL